MSGNRLRRSVAHSRKKLVVVIAAAAIFTGFALIFVFTQVRIQEMAREVAELDRKIKSVRERNLALSAQVAKRKSPGSLQNQIVYLNLNLVPIDSLPQLPVEAPQLRRSPGQMTAMEGGLR
ncbi:MAG: hypothetical protein OHK005_19400 [Candidatus Methylacidiphilales bacterium]